MKKALIVLMLVASTSVLGQSVTSSRNLSGGENFWSNGRYLGSTTRNLSGGRNFYPNQAYGNSYSYGFYGYHGSGNSHLQDGAAIGWGLSTIINSFRGNAQK